MKKLLSLLIAAAFIGTLTVMPVFAQENTTGPEKGQKVQAKVAPIDIIAELSKASGKSKDEVEKVLKEQKNLAIATKTLGISDADSKALLEKLAAYWANAKKSEVKKDESAVKAPDKKVQPNNENEKRMKIILELIRISNKSPEEVAKALGVSDEVYKSIVLKFENINLPVKEPEKQVNKEEKPSAPNSGTVNKTENSTLAALDNDLYVKNIDPAIVKNLRSKGILARTISIIAAIAYKADKPIDDVAQVFLKTKSVEKAAQEFNLSKDQMEQIRNAVNKIKEQIDNANKHK